MMVPVLPVPEPVPMSATHETLIWKVNHTCFACVLRRIASQDANHLMSVSKGVTCSQKEQYVHNIAFSMDCAIFTPTTFD